jgi:hypothetical protein
MKYSLFISKYLFHVVYVAKNVARVCGPKANRLKYCVLPVLVESEGFHFIKIQSAILARAGLSYNLNRNQVKNELAIQFEFSPAPKTQSVLQKSSNVLAYNFQGWPFSCPSENSPKIWRSYAIKIDMV